MDKNSNNNSILSDFKPLLKVLFILFAIGIIIVGVGMALCGGIIITGYDHLTFASSLVFVFLIIVGLILSKLGIKIINGINSIFGKKNKAWLIILTILSIIFLILAIYLLIIFFV